MSGDSRVRVFRRNFAAMGEYEGMEVDAYVVITDRYVVICDTLLCPEDMEAIVHATRDEQANRQLLVIDSHADWDHAWGNSYFTGAHATPIIAHDYCRTRILSEEAKTRLTDYQKRFPLFHNVVLTAPTITFTDSLTLYGGDLTLELIPAPGHHPDHIAVWIPELKLLLAFDAVENPLPIIENAAGVQPMLATLERFLALQPQRVLCSHGKTTSIAMVETNLAYLHEIERRCRLTLATHSPTQAELEDAATLINYPFDEVVATSTEPVDRKFYTWAYDNNVRCIMQWLMG